MPRPLSGPSVMTAHIRVSLIFHLHLVIPFWRELFVEVMRVHSTGAIRTARDRTRERTAAAGLVKN